MGVTPLSAALADSGFDASLPAVFTCEGLLYYLPPTAVDAIFADWGASAAPGVHYAYHCQMGSPWHGDAGVAALRTFCAVSRQMGPPCSRAHVSRRRRKPYVRLVTSR